MILYEQGTNGYDTVYTTRSWLAASSYHRPHRPSTMYVTYVVVMIYFWSDDYFVTWLYICRSATSVAQWDQVTSSSGRRWASLLTQLPVESSPPMPTPAVSRYSTRAATTSQSSAVILLPVIIVRRPEVEITPPCWNVPWAYAATVLVMLSSAIPKVNEWFSSRETVDISAISSTSGRVPEVRADGGWSDSTAATASWFPYVSVCRRPEVESRSVWTTTASRRAASGNSSSAASVLNCRWAD